MGFSCGIVGLPNVGKSTLFNALTSARAMAENYPFCTVDPNTGSVAVPDSRLHELARLASPERVVPATMNFVDIAGLISGASRGEGLGNQFLGHIRETDAIAHVVRCFEDEEVSHVEGYVDPHRDIDIIETELALADLDTSERVVQRLQRQSRSGDSKSLIRLRVLEQTQSALERGEWISDQPLSTEERATIRDCHFLTAKKVVYIANTSENSGNDAGAVDAIRCISEARGSEVVEICVKMEAEIAELEVEEREEFLRELGYVEPGLNRVVRAGYRLLGLHSFFTAGPEEVRAWTVPVGTSALNAAGAIHTDFASGFIRAEVVRYCDYVRAGGETAAKSAGKWRLEGKEYQIADGDVVNFRFNV